MADSAPFSFFSPPLPPFGGGAPGEGWDGEEDGRLLGSPSWAWGGAGPRAGVARRGERPKPAGRAASGRLDEEVETAAPMRPEVQGARKAGDIV